MVDLFKKTAIAEGISYLLFAITMPLKYALGFLWPNKIVGVIHGFLFVLYVFLALYIFMKKEQPWSFKDLVIILICSVIPFGTFWMEKKYLR